ncbi:hypothetical protein JVT61DRAFT_4738 [Boletus reticuloceps]|uniref:Uncharacterized protein n=1 Tax=Boletus reticuloceps TaxID=495285 RepID=A0A8I2YL01_9AGAM|nr:hypothetical protein JVT61DRAFT_4738 [Boletus reticuloceps]
MNAANPAQNIMAKTITIKSIARQFYVEFSVGDTLRLTDSARETETHTSWEKPLYFDGDDRSDRLVQVYRKHRVRKSELAGSHSDTIEGSEKLKDGGTKTLYMACSTHTISAVKVLEATLRKDTPDGPILLGITIKFALAAKPCGEANAEEVEVADPAKMVNTTVSAHDSLAVSTLTSVYMIYPYASTAWSAISIASKMLAGRKNRDDRIIRLVALMCTVFVSVENAEPLKGTEPYMETLALLLQQVAECGDFITEYAKSKHRISDVDL